MVEGVLQPISKLVGINISQTILHVRINHELGETQDLPREMERITKTTLLPLLRCQRLGRLEIEVIIK
eukprot:CAMPEP_0201703974 /NCGR_PEP_ID=MMETSP0578-20130828/41486_1 /ASSEMBLY_ACC=CAM_ASM_000663 /TAXON_ID=267565 /ORGANISM="Skeletonema grethea, Strain CCMP 1804" /LENGTH=67 /DNA_ID=CAMNT_0048191899 /DNA_START=99 /DNA_END=299 /DNA_ORIENTATION=-